MNDATGPCYFMHINFLTRNIYEGSKSYDRIKSRALFLQFRSSNLQFPNVILASLPLDAPPFSSKFAARVSVKHTDIESGSETAQAAAGSSVAMRSRFRLSWITTFGHTATSARSFSISCAGITLGSIALGGCLSWVSCSVVICLVAITQTDSDISYILRLFV